MPLRLLQENPTKPLRLLTPPVERPPVANSGDLSLLDEAKSAGSKFIDDIKAIPAAIRGVSPLFNAFQVFKATQAHSPEGVEQVQQQVAQDQNAALQVGGSVLNNMARPAIGIEKFLFPNPEESRLESAARGFLSPEKVPAGFTAGEYVNRMPDPVRMAEGSKEALGFNIPADKIANAQAILGGLLGTATDLAAFDIGGGASALRGIRQGNVLKGAAQDAEKILDELTPRAVKDLESKGQFPKDWTDADKVGRTRTELRKRIFGSAKEGEITRPEVGDKLLEAQKQKSAEYRRGIMFSEKGESELPSPPKKDDLFPAVPIAAGKEQMPPLVKSPEAQRARDAVEKAAAETATPTDAQKEAGNYKKGKVNIQGMDVSIEFPRGSTRSGVSKSGTEWSQEMAHHYGYVLGSKSSDGENFDVYIGPNPASDKVFVIDQVKDDGKFDEHKAMIGFDDIESAKKGYLDNYSPGWKGLGNITEMSVDQFKDILENPPKGPVANIDKSGEGRLENYDLTNLSEVRRYYDEQLVGTHKDVLGRDVEFERKNFNHLIKYAEGDRFSTKRARMLPFMKQLIQDPDEIRGAEYFSNDYKQGEIYIREFFVPEAKKKMLLAVAFDGKKFSPITSFEGLTNNQVTNIERGRLIYSRKDAGLASQPSSEIPARVIEDSKTRNLPQQDVRQGGTSKPTQNIHQPSNAVNKESDWWDEDLSISSTQPPPSGRSSQHSIEDQAGMEVAMLDFTGGLDPLEKAMKEIGKISPYEGGREAEEYREIPSRFKSAKGKPLDEVVQELANNHGIVFSSDNELRNALKNLGDSQKRFTLSPEVQTYLKSKDNVEALGKKLEEKISPAAYKRIIYSNVGLKSHKTPFNTSKEKMLKYILKAEAKGSKLGYMEGRRDLRTENRLKAQKEKEEREAAKRFTPQQRKELYQRAYSKGLIIKTPTGKVKDKLQSILGEYESASFDEIKNYINQLQGSQENPSPKILRLTGDINKDADVMKLINELSGEWQDINQVEVRTLDPVRQAEKVSGLDAWDQDNVVVQNVFDTIASADKSRFDEFNAKLQELYKNNQGLFPDTKASADAMRKAETGEPLSEDEQKVLDYIRGQNESLIRRANEIREKLGRKPIPYRKDYLTHIREFNLLVKLFKGDIGKINDLTNDQLEAIRRSDFTKPNAKFNPHELQRKGEKTKYDLVGNYQKYLETMLYEIYLSPAIYHARRFSDYAFHRFPNMAQSTTMLLNRMAGKPSSFDTLMKPVVSSGVVKWLRSQIAKNALIGNLNFNAINLANITTASGELGHYALKGLASFLGNKELRHLAFKHSSMLRSRKSQFDADVKAIVVFNPREFEKLTPIESARVGAKQLQYLAEGLTRIIEYNNVGSVWVGAYIKATEKFKFSQEKAFAYADTIARRTQVGYRPYEVNHIMASDTGKLFLQFQTWTFNAMNHLIYDLKLGNIPKQAKSLFSKTNPPTDVRYQNFFLLLGVLMLTNEVYRRAKLREPTSLSSAFPRVSFPAGRVMRDAGTVGRAGLRKVGIDRIGDIHISRPREATFTKARNRLLTNVLAPYGGAQLSRLLEGKVFPTKSEKKEKKKSTLRLLQ